MVKINNCSLIAADTYNYGAAVSSIKKSMAQCEFDRVIFFTDIPIKLDGIEVIQIKSLKGKDGYSEFMLKEAYKYITTDFVLITQHDSWVLDVEQFDERLYDVDYAGALWLENDGLANGNGGFSWRSKRLMECVGKDDFVNATSPEDVALCRVYRRYLEKNYNLIWASDEICEQFSFELKTPCNPTFGFHNFFHNPYQKTVVIRRMAAMGDVIQVQPLMQYFHDKGYRIVLDTLPQFYLLFLVHPFKINKLSEIDGRLLADAKYVNLDLSYESIPKQLHIKTYFEYAGVPESEYIYYLKTPLLQVGFSLNKGTKIFDKYVVIHIDNREQPGRNIYGVDWEIIAESLHRLGYKVIQVGRDDSALIKNAIRINCTNENFLCYVVGGADMMIGVDSGISHIATSFKVPSIIFFGSVNPEYIHPDLSNITVITNHNIDNNICPLPYCWHETVTISGQECVVNKKVPPCTQFKTSELLKQIKKLHENSN